MPSGKNPTQALVNNGIYLLVPWCVVADLLTMIAHICLPRCMIAKLHISCDIMAYLFVPYCLMTHLVMHCLMSYIPHALPMTTSAHGVHVDTVTLYCTSMYTSLYTPVRTHVSSTAHTLQAKLYCNHQHAEIVCLLSVLKFAMSLVPGTQAIPRQVPLLCRPPSLLVFKTHFVPIHMNIMTHSCLDRFQLTTGAQCISLGEPTNL